MTRRQALALTAQLAGCRSRQSEGHVRMVTSGSASVLGYLPHALAQHLGFYREQALSLEIESLLGAPKALMGGSADVVVGYFDHPVRLTALGRAVTAFVVLARCPGNSIVTSVRASKPIRHLTDLKGTLVGIASRGGTTDFFTRYLLSRHGLAPGDVRLVPVGPTPSALAALEQGKVDAWSGVDPGITRYRRRHPEAVILADARTADGLEQCTGAREHAGPVLYSTAEWLDSNATTARRLVRAIQQALQWIHGHTAEEIAQQVPAAFQGGDLEGYVQALRNSKQMYSRDGRMTDEAASSVHRMLAASVETVRTAQFDLSEAYTNILVAEGAGK
jgi:NitT/TauT family transport system substrate-binding protein